MGKHYNDNPAMFRTGKKPYTYVFNCTLLTDAKHINELINMQEVGREITYKTFIKHVDIQEIRALFDWYEYYGWDNGLHIKDDWGVSWMKSKWRGARCYYIIHSGIEYVFLNHAHYLKLKGGEL